MSFYSDFLAAGKHKPGREPDISDRTAMILCLVTVVAVVALLIGGSQLLVTIL